MSKSKMFDFSKFAKDAGFGNRIYDDPVREKQRLEKLIKSSKEVLRTRSMGYAARGREMDDVHDMEQALKKINEELKAKGGDMATDPAVSEAQRGGMFAAKAGKSNLGIPKKVGAEFAKADPGGKLPKRA